MCIELTDWDDDISCPKVHTLIGHLGQRANHVHNPMDLLPVNEPKGLDESEVDFAIRVRNAAFWAKCPQVWDQYVSLHDIDVGRTSMVPKLYSKPLSPTSMHPSETSFFDQILVFIMNWSHLKLVGCWQPTRLCFFTNCINNSSMMYYRGLHCRRLNHLNCASKTDKLLKMSHTCPATSRLFSKNGVGSLTSDYNIKTNFDCGELSKFSVAHQTDLFESYPSRTFSNRICVFTNEKSLNNGSFVTQCLDAQANSDIKSPRKSSSRQLSSVAFLNSQLLKPPSLGPCVLSRHFSTDGFYASLAQSPPVQTAQSLLLDIHQYLPWWAVILVATLAVRSLVVLPLAVHQAQVVGRLAAVNAEMNKLAPELNKEVELARKMAGWDRNQAKRIFRAQVAASNLPSESGT
ncbi:hypothetical protein JTE90_018323 [Oedothorax gibbosus]|uniref:Uncharacterized protein n=1 Tax=Oedothorax gibbosus TaxID=931172 RepID=A0AAV6TZU8_9ARAC|nr:hypothetical protein JTE90_018323 [Oedothorax gibbosus]